MIKKEKCYINGISCISAQNTFEDKNALYNTCSDFSSNILTAQEPSYKTFITTAMARRMAKCIKMSIATSTQALTEAHILQPQAIITGTGMGGANDSEKFLKALIDNDEQFLTPTSFIQSTHNTVGGQIALNLQCKNYNFTYVNGGISFESAVLDALIQIENRQIENALVGAVDEIAKHTFELYKLQNFIKNEKVLPYSTKQPSPGFIFGEGATFFALNNQKQQNTYYAQIVDVAIQNEIQTSEWIDLTLLFLQNNQITPEEIDVVVLGINHDSNTDYFYEIPQDFFANKPQLHYKHLCGEYDTASAFGVFATCILLKSQSIPKSLMWNSKHTSHIKNVLLYNHYQGKDHSWILLRN